MKGKQEKDFGQSRCKTIKSEEARNSLPLSCWGCEWRRQRLSKVLGHLHRTAFFRHRTLFSTPVCIILLGKLMHFY